MSIVWFILGLIGLNILAGIGFFIRDGVQTRESINQLQREIASQGFKPDPRLQTQRRSALIQIVVPILGIIMVLYVLHTWFSVSTLMLVLPLIPIILGFLGVFWEA